MSAWTPDMYPEKKEQLSTPIYLLTTVRYCYVVTLNLLSR